MDEFNLEEFESEIGVTEKAWNTPDENGIVFVPKVKTIDKPIDARVVVIPHCVSDVISVIKAEYVFLESDTFPIDWGLSECTYVYNGVKPNSVNFVKLINITGLNYIVTNIGVIVVDIDNRYADLIDIPSKLEGVSVISCNVANPFDMGSRTDPVTLGCMYEKLDNELHRKKNNINNAREFFKRNRKIVKEIENRYEKDKQKAKNITTARREESGKKVNVPILILCILFANWIGAILYLIIHSVLANKGGIGKGAKSNKKISTYPEQIHNRRRENMYSTVERLEELLGVGCGYRTYIEAIRPILLDNKISTTEYSDMSSADFDKLIASEISKLEEIIE